MILKVWAEVDAIFIRCTEVLKDEIRRSFVGFLPRTLSCLVSDHGPRFFPTRFRWCFGLLHEERWQLKDLLFLALYTGEMIPNLTVAYLYFKWVGETPPTRHVKYKILS